MTSTSKRRSVVGGGVIRAEKRPHQDVVIRVRRAICFGEDVKVERK